ncbi:MAG TPA: hypothetical protein P5509_06350 [Bacteroidales bacterium]|nr:hypothetical protein [Bacteroidales bacterium]
MEDNIEKIREYAKYSFVQAEKVKQYANVDVGNDVKSYEIGIGLMIIISLFLCLILC